MFVENTELTIEERVAEISAKAKARERERKRDYDRARSADPTVRAIRRVTWSHWYRGEGGQEAYKRYHLKRKFGSSPEAFEKKLAGQGGCCAICHSDTPGGRGQWHMDHCHESGRVRDILCSRCNLMLGRVGDDPDLLRAMADYLERHQCG